MNIRGSDKAIFDSISDGILLVDRDYKIIFVNKVMLQLCKKKKEDIIGQKCYNFSHQYPVPCYREGTSVICPHHEVFKTGKIMSVTHTHIMPDGSERIFEITASPINDEEGNVIQMVEVLKDVTEKKKAEKALKESEEKFRSLVEHSLVGVYLIQDNVFKYVNPQLAKIFGYSPEELIEKKGPKDLVYPEDWHIVKENLRKRLEGEIESINYTFRGLKKTGEVFDVEVFGTRTIYKEQPAVIGTLVDITERKRSEEILKESEEKYRDLVDNALIGVYKTNLKGDILFANKALAKMLEFESPEELMSGGVVARYKDPKDREVLIEKLKKTGKVDNFKVEVLTKTGKLKNILLSASLKGDVISGMIMDVTERIELENILKKRIKELEEFYDIAVGRELRMIELKEEIEKLREELKRYRA